MKTILSHPSVNLRSFRALVLSSLMVLGTFILAIGSTAGTRSAASVTTPTANNNRSEQQSLRLQPSSDTAGVTKSSLATHKPAVSQNSGSAAAHLNQSNNTPALASTPTPEHQLPPPDTTPAAGSISQPGPTTASTAPAPGVASPTPPRCGECGGAAGHMCPMHCAR